MFYTKLKNLDELLPLITGHVVVIHCEGCREFSKHDDDLKVMINRLQFTRTDITVINMPNACQTDTVRQIAVSNADLLRLCNTILIVSCGVGVQTVADIVGNVSREMFAGTETSTIPFVISACDTFPLPGFQGLTPSEHSCALCGNCHLNETAGICPVTSCSKSLLNGECGGAKNGMCEVNSDMPCGWEEIYKRLKANIEYMQVTE